MGFVTHSELERGFLADCDELGLSVSEDDLPMLMPALSFPFVFFLSFVALYSVQLNGFCTSRNRELEPGAFGQFPETMMPGPSTRYASQ